MKTAHVVQQKRFKRLLEIHALFVLTYLTACNSPLIEKGDTGSNHHDSPTQAQYERLLMVADILRRSYVDSFTFQPDHDTDVAEMIGRLDPYSGYLSKRSNEMFDAELNNSSMMKFGFTDWMQNDTMRVIRLNPFGFAKKTGLCLGDRLLAFDETSLVGRSREFLDSLFGSSNGSHYNVTILRPGEKNTRTLALRKSAIPAESGFCCFMVDSATAYLWFPSFEKGMADKVGSTVSLLHINHPKFANLVIDLRWNPGGFVDEAMGIISLFIATNAPVIIGRSEVHPQNNHIYKTNRGALLNDLNLTVLVNEHSCSASELLAGALQDFDRALIIGEQTCGKGLVMQKDVMPDGNALYLAKSRYYLPSGRCVQIPYENAVQKAHLPESDVVICNLLHDHEKEFRCNGRTFYTKNGRQVYDEMGVVPDILIPDYSTNYALGQTFGMDRFLIEFELIEKYQKLLLANQSFEGFEKSFPFNEAGKFVAKRLKEMTGESLPPAKSMALARLIVFDIQSDYYGIGTQTPETLRRDNLVTEAKRIIALDAAQAKREIANK